MQNFLLGKLKRIKGTASMPHTSDNRVVLVLADTCGQLEKSDSQNQILNRWPKAQEEYRAWFRSQNKFKIGETKLIQVQSDTSVCIMLCTEEGKLNVDALSKCLNFIGKEAKRNGLNAHVQKPENYSTDLEKLFIDNLVKVGVNLTIYE